MTLPSSLHLGRWPLPRGSAPQDGASQSRGEGRGTAVPPLSPAPINQSTWKRNSRKFAVTSERRFRFQGCRLLRTLSLSARIEDKFVGFVAKDCCEQWQLATLQVPENFSKERHIP